MEDLLRASGLDWTAVRPARLTNAAARGIYKVLPNRGTMENATNAVSRQDLARFMVSQISSTKYLSMPVAISD